MAFSNNNSIFSRIVRKSFRKSFLVMATLGLLLPAAASFKASDAIASNSSERTVLEDGKYLFGQSTQSNQIGSAYAVLSVENNQTVGAFYYPHSSFDCFSGQVSPERLAVNVVDSYSQATYPYEIALTLSDSLVAGSAAPAYTLEGFYQIDRLSEQDLEMLAVCEADLGS